MHWQSLKTFDEDNSTDTEGMISLTDLDITSPNLIHGRHYQGVNPAIFFEAIESASLELKEWTFVDLGCGKGRAVLLASLLSFKEIIGVEFSPTLVITARENLARFRSSQQQDRRVSIIEGDAADYIFSSNKIFLFLFNPFTSPVMDRVIANLVYACEHKPAEAFVVYATPVCHDLFLRTDACEVAVSSPKFTCYRFPAGSPRRV
jgi:SAM-dependent methyltransferase